MPAGKVPTSNITALYNNTTAGTDADPAAVDNAVQDIVQTINDNFDKQVGDISNHASSATLAHPDKSVTRAKLADKVVGAGQLDDAAVGQSHHQDNGIPSRALPDNVILQRHMSDNSVGSAEIIAGAVQARHITNGVVGTNQLDPTLLQNYGDIAVNTEFDKRGIDVHKFANQVVGSDWTNAFAAAVAACPDGGKLIVPTNTYTGKFVINKPITIDFMGSTLIPPNGSDAAISATGTKGANNYILSGTLTRGAKTIQLTVSPTDIAPGDLIVLRDDTARVSDGATDVNMEVHEVKAITTSTITLKDFVRLPKAVSSTANVYKITPISNIVIRDVNLQATNGATGNAGVFFDMCRNARVENVKMNNSVGPCVTFRRSYQCFIDGFAFKQPQLTGSGQGYGVQGTSGTNGLTILNGTCDGLRHVVDCGNTFDVLADNVIATNSTENPFVISHNGWDADITFRHCKSYGGTNYAFCAASTGVSDPYSIAIYGIRILDCEAEIDVSSFTSGLYFQMPVKDSLVDGLMLTFGTGALTTVQDVSGVRILPVDNDITIRNVTVNGFKYGIQHYNASAKTQILDADRVVLQNININNCDYGLYTTFVHAICAENIRINNIGTKAVVISYGSTGEQPRYISLKGIRLNNVAAGKLLTYSGWTVSGGCFGEIMDIQSSSATSTPLTVAASQALTHEDILLNRNGTVVQLVSTAAVTLAVNPLAAGLIEGQRLTLLNNGSFDITIPQGNNMTNNGGTSIVLNAAKRAVGFIWSNNKWIQVS